MSLSASAKLQDLSVLKSKQKLIVLELSNIPKISDFNFVSQLSNLEGLGIDGGIDTEQPIDSLEPIAKLKHLKYLTITGTKIKDKSLEPLLALDKLTMLLSTKKLPKEEIAKLKRLPNLKFNNFQYPSPMKYKKIDFGYYPQPNITSLKPVMKGKNLVTDFFLNNFIDENVKEDDKGELKFFNCKAWRYGAPNDEAFFGSHGSINYHALGFECHELYEVENFETEFTRANAKLLKLPKMKHFMFFTKEGTLECIAESVEFTYIHAS